MAHDEKFLDSLMHAEGRCMAESYYEHMTKWIPIREKIPVEDRVVLLLHGRGEDVRCKAGYSKYEDGPHQPPTFYGLGCTNIRYDVSHWMELPEFPNNIGEGQQND